MTPVQIAEKVAHMQGGRVRDRNLALDVVVALEQAGWLPTFDADIERGPQYDALFPTAATFS